MANGYGYEEWNPAEQAAREAQEKALAATRAAEEEQAFIEQGSGGFVAPPSDVMGGLLTGNGGTGVTGNGTKSDARVLAQGPLYRGAKREDIPTGLPTVITGNGNGTNGQQTDIISEIPGVQNGVAYPVVPTIPTTPTTPQPGVQNGEAVSGFPSTQDEAFIDITGEEQAQSEAAAAAGTPSFLTDTDQQIIGTDPKTGLPFEQAGKAPVSTAPVSTIQQSSEEDLSDEDFSNLWGRVTRGDISMADIGNWLRFETTDVGEGITGTKLTARSEELLKQAFEVSEIDREKEQIAYAKDIEKAKLTGDFKGAETLELRKTKYQEKLARAEATGMFGEEATLAKQKLDLEERIDYANRTGMYKDPNTKRYEKTLLLKKMEQDKELADAEMEMQKTALMGADPGGVVTFAKEQWLDKINTEKDRYEDAVSQQGLENDMMMLEILGTSKRDAYVYDENGNIQFDRDGEPILQTLAARRLAEDMLTGQADREDIKARTAELVRSNEKAEEFRLMEIMGFDKDKAKTFAAKQFDEKVRVAKKAEELRETELELERTMLASQMDLQRQQIASQNLALMLQNPAAFGALTALTGGGMPQQLQGLGMQVPTTQQPAQTAPQTPQQGIGQFFQGGIPTTGQLGQLDPQALQTLTNMLGFAGGITPQQFGRAAAGVTPGGVQAPPPRVYPQNAIQAVTSGRLV
jgi:hypothetical protein|tara:strand:+ start:419 stop:2491 length:2073 start_codon:yes stop_codon:yes gene_type:complete